MATGPRRHILNALWRAGLATVLLLAFVRCDLTDPAPRYPLVVEAFLETGRALPTVTLRETQPLDGTPVGPGASVRGAGVELVVDGQSISYESVTGTPGRYTPESGAEVVPPGVSWELDVKWKGEVARARGRTPPSIELSEMCVQVPERPIEAILVDSLRRDSLDIPAEEGYIFPVDVSLHWTPIRHGSDTSHWVRPRVRPDTAESASRVVNFFLEPVEVRREDRFRIRGGDRYWQGVYAIPVEDSTSAFPRHTLTATLVRGDTSFAAFARSRNDPERREPISNVTGGLGIATAIAMDSLERRVERGLKRCYVGAGDGP